MERLKNMKETLIGCVQMQLADIKNANTEELGEAIDMIKDLDEAMYYCAKVKALEEKKEEKKELKEKLEKMEKENPQEFHHYYTERLMPIYPPDMYDPFERDIDRGMGRMYYSPRQPRNARGEFTDGRGRDGGRSYYDGYGNEGRGSGSSGGNSGGSSSGNRGGNSSGGTSYYTEREMPFELRDIREGRSPMSRRMYMESKEMHKDKNSQIKELEKYMQELSDDIVEMIEDASPEERQVLEKKMTNLVSKVAQLNV